MENFELPLPTNDKYWSRSFMVLDQKIFNIILDGFDIESFNGIKVKWFGHLGQSFDSFNCTGNGGNLEHINTCLQDVIGYVIQTARPSLQIRCGQDHDRYVWNFRNVFKQLEQSGIGIDNTQSIL